MLSIAFAAAIPAAQADEDLHVLTAGGTDRLEGLTVATPTGADPELQPNPATSLQLADGNLATYTDVLVMPGDDLLLGDGSGRGAVLFDENGNQTDALDDPGQFDAPSTVAVASFLSENRPERLLMGDDSTGRIHLYDTVDDAYVWSYAPEREGVSAEIAAAAALPEDRVGVAAVWPSLGVSTVEVFGVDEVLDADPDPELALVSESTDGENQVVVDGLHPVRDLRADLDGKFLVTSRDQIGIYGPAGEELWRMHLADDVAVAGQLQAAHWVDDELVAAATRQPGRWNEPHENHRIHLLDTTRDTPRLSTSSALQAAPLQIDSATGHGATKTRGYYADALDTGGGDPRKLTVADGPVVDPEEVPLDESALLEFSIENDTGEPVSIRRVGFGVASGECDDEGTEQAFPTPWWSSSVAGDVADGELLEFGPSVSAEVLEAGSFCGRVTVVGRDGTRHLLGDPVAFEILAPGDREDPVRSDDLGTFEDAGQAYQDEPLEIDDPPGCTCSGTGGSGGVPAGLVVALIALVGIRVRRT